MKKTILALFYSIILFVNNSCLKDSNNNNTTCTNKTVQSEQPAIVAYAAANGINATAHSSGLYYQIAFPGSGISPTATSKVFVTYTGKLTNGTIFDTQTNISFLLKDVISGWQIGIPLIQKGGFIKLIIPSALGYGCRGTGPIPGDAIIYFDIQLLDVQ